MGSVVICGTQWGDEGKGMVVDIFGEKADLIVRYQGGNNAGHTVKVNNVETILHHIPSGILHKHVTCIIGNGVVVYPEILLDEISRLKAKGYFADSSQLLISDRAHVIMPYHTALDLAREKAKGEGKIGTTGRGIGPTYRDKAGRGGVRFGILIKPDLFKAHLEKVMPESNFLLEKFYGEKPLSVNEVFDKYSKFAEQIAPNVTDTSAYLHKRIKEGAKVLFEGAQGAMLDIDHGTYPYVTSSNTTVGAVMTGTGVGPYALKDVFGVVKAYTTRVGAGPFPTELTNEIGKKLQDVGREYGSTTGRPRRCGWLDLSVVKYANRLNGLTGLVLTKLDVLDGIDPIKVCIGYKLNGNPIEHFPGNLEDLASVEPIYEEFPGWTDTTIGIKTFDGLPENAKKYINQISKWLDVPLAVVSIGPGRDETIVLNNPFV